MLGALAVLLGCAFGLLALGGVARVVRGPAALAGSFVCLLGFVAALVALVGVPVASVSLGLSFGVDGVSGVVLAALFLVGAAGMGGPVVVGALALAVLAGDAAGFVLGAGGAVLATGTRVRPSYDGEPSFDARWLMAGVVAGLVAAILLLGGLDPRFAAIRAVPPEGLRAALVLAVAVAAVAVLPMVLPGGLGGLFGVYVVARLMLDLAGPMTPVWWGVPVLVLGAAWAVLGARHAAAADDLERAGSEAGLSAQGVAMAALGAALLARGADLLPLASLAVSGALLQVLGWAVWGGVLAAGAGVVRVQAGGAGLGRLGGLLRRAPVTGLALLAAFGGMGALPLSAGFAGLWPAVQGLAGAGRLGGVALVMVAAAALSALGLAVALLGAAAVRLGGVLLLGTPRSARAAGMTEAPRRVQAGMAALAGLAVVLGVCPGLGLMLAQPGARLLAGGVPGGMPESVPDGAGWLGIGLLADGRLYAAVPLAVLVVAGAAGAGWAARGTAAVVPAWEGGAAADETARGNVWPLHVRWPWSRIGSRIGASQAVLAVLALVLAACVGWAAR